MKHSIFFSAILCLGILCVSCRKDIPAMQSVANDSNTPNIFTQDFKAAMMGDAEVPTHSSNASGSFDATYNNATRTLNYKISYTQVPGTDFKPTVAHIHKGLPGENGNQVIIFDLGPVRSSPYTGSITLTADQLAYLKNGYYYVHIHSMVFPDGDIRGQIRYK